MSANYSASELVQLARKAKGLKQKAFASELGKSQGVVSRYESGEVDPPADVIMHCMHILKAPSVESSVSLGAAVHAVRNALDALTETVDHLQRMAVANGDMTQSHAADFDVAGIRESS